MQCSVIEFYNETSPMQCSVIEFYKETSPNAMFCD